MLRVTLLARILKLVCRSSIEETLQKKLRQGTKAATLCAANLHQTIAMSLGCKVNVGILHAV